MPKFDQLFNEVLAVLSGGKQVHRREMHLAVVDRLKLSDSERSETFAFDRNKIFYSWHSQRAYAMGVSPINCKYPNWGAGVWVGAADGD